jgi:hypothetical protein
MLGFVQSMRLHVVCCDLTIAFNVVRYLCDVTDRIVRVQEGLPNLPESNAYKSRRKMTTYYSAKGLRHVAHHIESGHQYLNNFS